MIQQIKKSIPTIELGVLIGILTFLLTVLTTTFWQNNGISLGELVMLPLIGGFYLFITTMFINVIGLNKIRRLDVKNNAIPIKKIYQVLIIIGVSVFVYTSLDSIYFLFDSSLSEEYASSLETFLNSSEESTDDIKDFEKIPFSMQNVFSSITSAIITGLISLPFIKSDGEIFKSKKETYNR